MRENLYTDITSGYRRAYGDNPSLIARAPGRVNIIGEHTDYNGLPVLPTAIDREIAIAISGLDSNEVVLANVDERFGERRFNISGEIEPFPAGDWGNYAKAAAQAIWNWVKEHSPDDLPLRGFSGFVGGTIPPASGLSSSSAMVVASAFALVAVNDISISKEELASLLARAERYVGTEGGGMDQAASILSKEGCVLRIDFNPLRTEVVPLPDDCAFVIANSMVHADKAGSARMAYNTRVAECRLGVRMLKAISCSSYPEVEGAVLLGDVMRTVPDWKSLIDELPEGSLSLAAASKACGIPEAELRDQCLRMRNGSLMEEPADGFHVKKRCRHVLTEAERVSLAASAMREGRLDDLGRHMNDSHESCAKDYEVSCKELDVLADILRRHGAIGARLTGAGFGGCAVAAVRKADADALLNGLVRDYYQTYLVDNGIKMASSIESAAFKCVASAGAGTISVEYEIEQH